MKISGRFNASVLSVEQLAFLISEAGMSYGLGEWRNEKKGIFGAFRLASAEEEDAWEAYVAGKGEMPNPNNYFLAAE